MNAYKIISKTKNKTFKRMISPYTYPGIETKRLIKLKSEVDLSKLLKSICHITEHNPEVIRSKRRFEEVVKTRFIFCYIARRETPYTMKLIADFLNRDHSSVVNAVNTVKDIMSVDNDYKEEVKEIHKKIRKSKILN